MDLQAYMQIEDLSPILKENNIDIPRLRGIDLCVTMTPWTKEDIDNCVRDLEFWCCEGLCCSDPFWNPNSWVSTSSEWTDHLRHYYMEYHSDSDSKVDGWTAIRWDRIHGWKRKVLKTYIHNRKTELLKYVEKYNSYCGREDLIRVHSRMGGNNWAWDDADWIKHRNEIVSAPWFVDRVDDWFDDTYCDFYCKISN